MFLSNRLSYQVIKYDPTMIIAQLQIFFLICLMRNINCGQFFKSLKLHLRAKTLIIKE